MTNLNPAILTAGVLAQIKLPQLKALRTGLKAQIDNKLCANKDTIRKAFGKPVLRMRKIEKPASALAKNDVIEIAIAGNIVEKTVNNTRPAGNSIKVWLYAPGEDIMVKTIPNDKAVVIIENKPDETSAIVGINSYLILQSHGFTGSTMEQMLVIIDGIIETAETMESRAKAAKKVA